MSVTEKFLGSIGGLAESTKTRYGQLVTDFMRRVGKKESYDTDDVLKYLAYLEKKEYSPNYRRWVFTVLRIFYDVMDYQWWQHKEERRIRPKGNDPQRPFLRQAELEKVIEAVASKPPMIQSIIRIACLLPIRRVEFHNLNRKDYTRPNLRISTAKGGEPKTVTLDNVTCDLLDKYLEKRVGEEEALFVTQQGRISTTYLSLLTRAILEEAGIYRPRLSLHGFRRGVTTMLHHAGMSEKELTQLGGWRNEHMVHIYIQLEPGEADHKARMVHPLIKGE